MKSKRTKLFWLYVVSAIIVLVVTIPYFFWVEEWDYELPLQAAFLFVTCVVSAWFEKDKPSVKKRDKYEEAYKDIIGGAFSEDKKSYKKLVDATICYNFSKDKQGIRILEKLEKKCKRTADYSAVFTFKGLCFEDGGKIEQAINCYEKVLHYDMTNSLVWSNVGLLYMKTDRKHDAYTAYSNALLYDEKNPCAHTNIACLLIDEEEPQRALEHALRAVELNANMPQAMSAAAVSYKMLGDEQNAQKYRNMYRMNGGNADNLDARLAGIEEELKHDA